MLTFLKKNILPLLLFCGFFVVYSLEASRSIYGGDVGDLVTAAYVRGVPHPPGYPLFTFLGFLLSHSIAADISPAFAVGLISCISGALGIVFFFLITKNLTKNNLTAFISSLIIGFSFFYWFYAEIAEVFELNVFFALCLFYLAILFQKNKKILVFYIFLFTLGLSCTNHETIALIFPSLFLLVVSPFWQDVKKHPQHMIYEILCLVLGLVPFLYIFIASSSHPIINWDNVHNISSFFHLILRKDYGTFEAGIFSTPTWQERLVTVGVYLSDLVVNVTIPVSLLTVLGFFKLFQKEKSIFSAILLSWVLSGPIFLAYAGFPLTSGFIIGAYERFTILPSVLFLIPFGIGLLTFINYIIQFLPKRHYDVVFQCLFFLIPLMLFVYNFPKTNLSTLTIGNTYAEDFLTILPPHAILLISGDTQIFNTWYIHYVLHERPDVLVYNLGATPVTNNIIGEALSGIPQQRQSPILIATVEKLEKTRPVFSTTLFQPKTGSRITWVPYGLVSQMYLKTNHIPTKRVYEDAMEHLWHIMHVPTKSQIQNQASHDLTIADIPSDYSNGLIATGTFIYTNYKDVSTALFYYKKAIAIAPDNDKAYSTLGVLQTGIPGQCVNAIGNLSESLVLNAYQELPYFLLYNLYINCVKEPQKAQEIASTYTAIFQKNFQTALKQAEKSLKIEN